MDASKEHDIFRRIIQAARIIKEKSYSGAALELALCQAPLDPLWDVLPSTLTLSSDIVDLLVADGIPLSTAQKLCDKLNQAEEALRRQLESSFRETWMKILRSPSHDSLLSLDKLKAQLWDTYKVMYTSKSSEWTKDVRRMASERVQKAHAASVVQAQDGGRPAFNHSYVRVLETYFAENQKPTKADKTLLAQKSGMTYRQIHIWFQNRRSRVRKAGQSGSNEKSYQTLPRNVVRSNSEECSSSRSSSVTLVDNDNDCGFPCAAPPYAFPAVYPPSISAEDDPFPCRFGDLSNVRKTCWARKPALKSCLRHEADVSALVLAFEKLQIGHVERLDSVGHPARCLQASSKDFGSDVTSPYTIRPLRAPLCSLIRNFASRVLHRSGKSSDDAQSSRHNAVAKSVVEDRAQAALRKARRRPAPAAHGNAVLADQNSSPFSQSANEPSSSFADDSSPIASACNSSTDQVSKVKKSTKKPTPRRAPAVSTPKRSKDRSAPAVQAAEPSSKPPAFLPSPAASIESLPPLSYSSGSSSASSYSQSPTTSFASLSDDGFLPSLDPYQPSNSSLTLPPAQGDCDDFPPPMFASSGEIPFDFSKGPLDLTFNLDLPTCPSYSESFDSISRGLQSSPDFAPPALTLDFPSFPI